MDALALWTLAEFDPVLQCWLAPGSLPYVLRLPEDDNDTEELAP